MSRQKGERTNHSGAEYQEEQSSDAASSNYGNQKPDWRSANHLEKFQESLDQLEGKNSEQTEFKNKVAEDFRNEKT